MKQVLESYRTGELELADVPAPAHAPRGRLLVATRASLVSAGTEKAMVDIAKKSLVGKALARPDWVKQVVDKVRTEGPLEAYRQSMARLEAPMPMGYSSAGVVLEVGRGIGEFSVGDRVACAGSGYASHVEVACVPRNLCVAIPDAVSFEQAAFVALGGIALEAVRMARVELGHRVAVIGLGLLGQLTVQLLRAAGCHVLAMDINAARAELARRNGAAAGATNREELLAITRQWTNGLGADAVIITAATDSNEPIVLSGDVCRERGTVVATGMVGLDIPRKVFYEKELQFVVSRAWGPGMYDPDFEQRDAKYPPAYVRWTAQTNMAEFLAQLAGGQVRLDDIITHRFPIDQAVAAYQLILGGQEPALGVVLTYGERQVPGAQPEPHTMWLAPQAPHLPVAGNRSVGLSLVGAGLYARGTLLPALRKVEGYHWRGVATASGASARQVATGHGFAFYTSDAGQVMADPECDAVLILTRHGSHAHFATQALAAGKHVFVEKPLALDVEGLRQVACAYLARAASAAPVLMVGFNRRFAPTTTFVHAALAHAPGPMLIYVRCNAGYAPPESWVHDQEDGGGRLIGEACHFVDLIQYLAGGVTTEVYATPVETAGGAALHDNLTVHLKLDNGSAASLIYTSAGDKAFPREYVEIFSSGAAAVIDNFKSARVVRGGKTQKKQSLEVDRGHVAEMAAFVNAVRRGGPGPVGFREYAATTLATFAMLESIQTQAPVAVDVDAFLAGVGDISHPAGA